MTEKYFLFYKSFRTVIFRINSACKTKLEEFVFYLLCIFLALYVTTYYLNLFLEPRGPAASGSPQSAPPPPPHGHVSYQSKYGELLNVIEDLGREIKPTYAGSKMAQERLKKGDCFQNCP